MPKFTVTENHLKLLDRMYVSWDDCEYGAPSIDPKRPYGNSYVPGDIAEILEWPLDAEDELSDDQDEDAWEIHREMQSVLQILIDNRGIEEGVYIRDGYSKGWIKG